MLQNGVPGYRLNLVATLASVRDVPADQGGWLRVKLGAAAGDVSALQPNITGYNLWRRIDSASNASVQAFAVASGSEQSRMLPVSDLLANRTLDVQQAQAAGMPPGSWESLGFNAATQSATK